MEESENGMPSLRLHTNRLELVACTLQLVKAEIGDRHEFSRLLGAHVPDRWPPPLNDESSLNWTLNMLTLHPGAVGWSTWYILLKNGSSGERTAVGNGGFKGRPLPDGTVEIGYSVMEAFQRKGYATEAARRLVAWAFEHPEVTRVIAETYPHIATSLRVLEKCGFDYIGGGSEMLTICYELKRTEYNRLNCTK